MEDAFGAWPQGEPAPSLPAQPVKARSFSLIDRPGAEQSTIFMGLPVIDPASADFFFCGGKALAGLPYCAHHSRVAYQPASDRRRPSNKPQR